MVSLMECDYKEFLDMQPVSKSCLENLRDKAKAGDLKSKELFRKQIFSLAAHIALEYACDGMDTDYLLRHIDSEDLVLLSRTNLFFYFLDPDSHIHCFRTHIGTVINRSFIATHDGKLIGKEQYRAIAKLRKRNLSFGKVPPTQITGVPENLVRAVLDNEVWKEKEKVVDRVRFRRLKQIVRDQDDMSLQEKMNLLLYLMDHLPDREFFYFLYGVDDDVCKSTDAAALHFGISANDAFSSWDRILNTGSTPFSHLARCGGVVLYRPDPDENPLTGFLCKNRQNRNEYMRFLDEQEQDNPSIRIRPFRDYLD